MVRWVLLLALVFALAPFAAVGCGTDATGIETCKRIEEARCNQAPRCPSIDLQPPYSTSGTDVQACIRFYDTACLHGLAVSDPGSTSKEVSACVNAIDTASGDAGCATIEAPWEADACSWLNPAPEASTDAEAGDAGDAGDANDASATLDGVGDAIVMF
jgi:hypothetical protein